LPGVARVYSPPCPWDTHYQCSIKTLLSSGGALAPEPPRATRIQPEPNFEFILNKFGLSRLNPIIEKKKRNEQAEIEIGSEEFSESFDPDFTLSKKKRLSRFNPIFAKKNLGWARGGGLHQPFPPFSPGIHIHQTIIS